MVETVGVEPTSIAYSADHLHAYPSFCLTVSALDVRRYHGCIPDWFIGPVEPGMDPTRSSCYRRSHPVAGVRERTAWCLDQDGVGIDVTVGREDRIGFGNTHRHVISAVSS